MDQLDQAQAFEEQHRADALSRIAVQVNVPVPESRDCNDCGEPIPKARLQASPSAKRCIVCQERFERRQQGIR
ncbi:TraR/DksA C4-type zinc finger protein [Thiomicrorhabdus indica]|uniref:TraR/DksA C4-type zinc finger protein n=1 Tax=Thiomicrorhabdus indica TaxID=2267253 RepID=UPI002AA948A7|nr:TraR/DksA C4-type zinc finger protein [Thiomicrorhabdus indica]